MDSTRFKRRETQTQRQIITDFRPSELPSQPSVAAVPQMVADDSMTVGSLALSGSVQATETPLETPRRRSLLDMALPGGLSPENNRRLQVYKSRWRSFRRWAFRATAVAMILLLVGGGILFSQGYLKLHKAFKGGTITAAALKANVDPNLLKGEGDGRINVLLLGRGGGTHDAPDLTDTMMLASIDPVNNTSTLISIPRDLWVTIPKHGSMKINAAWETGEFGYLGKVAPGSTNQNAIQAGFDMADQVVESVLGVPIHYNAIVDFNAFKQAVDTVGGVTVDVPTDLVDPTMAWENSGNSVLAKAGIQQFDGKQALIYVRSRETTSDFARADRQRSVILAIKDKVKTLGTLSNPLKLSGLLGAFGNNVSTDFSLSDASRFYSIVSKIDNSSVTSDGLGDAKNSLVTTGNISGQSVVLPKAGAGEYTAIQSFVRSQLKDPYILKENAKLAVYNGTTVVGTATTKADELKSYGYNVVAVANAPTSGYDQTVLVDLTAGKDKYTKHYLEQRYNTTAVTKLPDATIQTNGADFVIILGSDATSNP